MNLSQKMPVKQQMIDAPMWSLIKKPTLVGVSAQVRDSIVAKLENKEYRNSYVSSSLKNGLAHQIRVNREARNLSQTELASRCGSKTRQETISRLEDPAYGNYSINTLLKIASAMDVALLVKFVPYSKFLIETADKSISGLYAENFEKENLYLRQAQLTITEEKLVNYLEVKKKQLTDDSKKYDLLQRESTIKEGKDYIYESRNICR